MPQQPNVVLNSIGRTLSWLVNALGLRGQEVPQTFHTMPVRGIVDVFQSGWATAEYLNVVFVKAANTGIQSFALPEGIQLGAGPIQQDGVIHRIFAMQISHVGGAAALDIRLDIAKVQGTGAAGAGVSLTSVGVGAIAYTDDILGARDNVVSPPGFTFTVEVPATAVGETVTIQAVIGRIKSGGRP